MFTGLVKAKGTVLQVNEVDQGRRLVLASPLEPEDLKLGASVCINGVCLTVVEAHEGRVAFDAAFETLQATTLGACQTGDAVNLEPSLRVGDALGGHLVAGHVDGVGEVRRIDLRGDAWEVWMRAPAALLRFLAVKGSVTVDGVSLTINALDDVGFMVGIIPHTLQVTTLGQWRVGHRVNLEVDVLARYVARLLELPASSPNEDET